MNRNGLLLILILVGVIGLLTFFYTQNESRTNPDNDSETPATTTPSARGMSIDSYVRANINELSPEPAVLGGTFYVTGVEVGDGRGVVEYEDGHIALTADFTYEIEPEHGAITITSFTVRGQ